MKKLLALLISAMFIGNVQAWTMYIVNRTSGRLYAKLNLIAAKDMNVVVDAGESKMVYTGASCIRRLEVVGMADPIAMMRAQMDVQIGQNQCRSWNFYIEHADPSFVDPSNANTILNGGNLGAGSENINFITYPGSGSLRITKD